MKYCPRCANIVSDKSNSRFEKECCNCHIPFEEDEMTGDMFESLSEKEKENYTISLLNNIKQSPIFEESACYYGHPDFYWSYWFDKYEELMKIHGSAWRANRIETEEEHNKWLQNNFGKNSQAYQQAVVQNCINAERKRKYESSNVPRCPICQSTDLKKLGKLSFMNSFGVNMSEGGTPSVFPVFGVKRNDKTWKCNNCGSKF